MTLRTAGLSSRVCGSLLTRPVTLSDLTSPLRASLKCKTKIIRKLQIVYISRSCDQEQPQVNSCEALRIVVGKKETKCMLTTQLQAKQCWKKEDNLSTKNFISAFALIQGWHNLKKSTINNRAAMFLIPHFLCKDLLSVFLLCISNTRWQCWHEEGKTIFSPLSLSCLITFWLVFESPTCLVFLVWAQPSAESYRRAAEGLTGNLNARCFRKSWLMQREVRSLFLYIRWLHPILGLFFLRRNRPRDASAHWAAAWRLAQSALPAWRGCPVLGISRFPQLMSHLHSARVGVAAAITGFLCGRDKGLPGHLGLHFKNDQFFKYIFLLL